MNAYAYLIVTINLFNFLYSHQITPIIGGKCDTNASDVLIGGKETQFFLKCEPNSQSESGKGVWVVKSRIVSVTTTAANMIYTNLPAKMIPQTRFPSNEAQQKSDSSICVQDKNAREGDLCSVSLFCLQQDQRKAMNYLQCDQSTSRWKRKSCLNGQIFSFEHQTCVILNTNLIKDSRFGPRYQTHSVPIGIVCTFMQCSHIDPCQRGTCNNGFCCFSSIGTTSIPHPHLTIPSYSHSLQQPNHHQQSPLLVNQVPLAMSHQQIPFLISSRMDRAFNPTSFNLGCSNGASSAGSCINMRCARGYVCSPGNQCCPSNDFVPNLATTANPIKNPFLCVDGTQAAGACILGQCGSPFTCIKGLCCNRTANTPRCLDGSPSVGACLLGQCGAGFICTTGNLCCRSLVSNAVPQQCPNGGIAVGACINGLCPTGYVCINEQCCPQSGNSTFRCSNLNYVLGPCVGNQCPDDGFQCDTSINSCCPITDPVGPCIEPGDQCPVGHRCFTQGTTPLCYRECDGRGTITGPHVGGVCPDGTTLIFGFCCTLRARFYNAPSTSFLSSRHLDLSSSRSASVGLCPDGSGAVSACIDGDCGSGYQCYNNLCCHLHYATMMLPFSSTSLRPIGTSCEFTQQCASSMEGLSICELGICRCLPGAFASGIGCERNTYVLLNDAEQLPINNKLTNESKKIPKN